MTRKIGLALGSGGARGVAHVGVIKELEKMGVKIDMIAGSSAGALIGGMYAAGVKIGKIEEMISSLDFLDVWKLMADPVWGAGIVKGRKFMEFLKNYVEDKEIGDLKIRYCAVATDLKKGRMQEIRSGSLLSAIRASCSIPLIFEPYERDGVLCIDGGVTSPVPVRTLRKMGADKVIAVNLDAIYFGRDNQEADSRLTTLSVVRRSLNILRHNLARLEMLDADVVLEPETKYVTDFDFAHKEQYLKSGEESVQKNAEKILDL